MSLCGHGALAVLITSETSWTKGVIFLLHVALVRPPLECGVPSWALQWQENYWETEASPSENCQGGWDKGRDRDLRLFRPREDAGQTLLLVCSHLGSGKTREQVLLRGAQWAAADTSGNMLQGKNFTMRMLKKSNKCPEQWEISSLEGNQSSPGQGSGL